MSELVAIMKAKAKREVNSLGDYWSDDWCEDAATRICELQAENKRLMDDRKKLVTEVVKYLKCPTITRQTKLLELLYQESEAK